MKKFAHLLWALALMAVCWAPSPPVHAAGTTANLAWVLPTTYNDCTPQPCAGSPLPASDIASVTLNWAPIAPQVGPTGTVTIAGAVSSTTQAVPCGSVSFDIIVKTTATAKYPNSSSGASNFVPYATGLTCAPNPASGLTVN